MFKKILLATRGEIAARVARTCKRMGITTVCVHGEVDGDSLHVQACDEAVPLATPEGTTSYMNVDALIAAAKQVEADAIHPGYGMLASDPAFAERVVAEGLVLLGPSAEMLRLCQDKKAFRVAADEVSVRMPPFEDGEFVRIPQPRHLEVQLICDNEHEIITLGERECSVRHDGRRLLAESPAPALAALPSEDYIREALNEAAIRLVAHSKFVGPVSVKFLLDPDGIYYCTGVVAGLTPEHALHEMCTSTDIVEAQIRIAAGEPIPDELLFATPTGHAVEGRVAWDTTTGPATGVVSEIRFPPVGAGKVRIETGFAPGTHILDAYDDVVASVIAYAPARHQAVLSLDRVIAETTTSPQKTNIPLLRRVLGHEGYRAGQFDVTFVERMLSQRL